ncbi:hypothetical protein [Deinococcus sp.]|uniref:hypothetical protein n=1 Tax=Deinococcus sp. TaxID=47478 RepID=UPI003C7B7F21
MKPFLTAMAVALFMASCAPTYTPYSVKPDADQSCSHLRVELARAKSVSDGAAKNRGLSAQNVAWAVLFLPGMVANEYTNDQVQRRAADRIATLNRLYTVRRR